MEEKEEKPKINIAAEEAIGEKFAKINKHIEAGEEVPFELSKNFIVFPLVEDPYKDIE